MPAILETMAPGFAARRARARLELARIKHTEQKLSKLTRHGFEGASNSRRLASWVTNDTGPAGSIPYVLDALRTRSRHLRQNNPFAHRMIEGIAVNVVGDGIQGKVKGPQSAIERWNAWADSTDCDADGQLNFYGLQTLVMKTIVESGEVLIRKRPRPRNRNLLGPIQLQVLEPDHLAAQLIKPSERIKGGIEYDANGDRVAYHLYKEHPKEANGVARYTAETVRVPADEIIHLFRVDRAGQTRGVPWLAPVMTRLYNLDVFEDATLEKQKVAACFAALVTGPDAPNIDADEDGEPPIDRLEPGMVEHLPPGHEVHFGNPPSSSDYPEYTRSVLRSISVGSDVTYELLTNDYSQANFTSMRMSETNFGRFVESWRWHTLIPGFCDRVFRWFEAYELTPRRLSVTWTAPRRAMVDPAREVPAQIKRMRAGLVSLPEALREDGYDPDKVLSEIEDSNRELDRREIVLDSDPRKVSMTGQAQQQDAAPPEEKEV